jgi:o-succinylbenzoate---CoA ligase
MSVEFLISREFWEGGENHVAGVGLGDVSYLEGCVIFRTSGSTGGGKWVVLEKSAMMVSARAVNEWLGVSKESRWGVALPLDHVGGFAILARVFVAGCGVAVFEGRWDAGDFVRWVEKEGVTHTSLVPTQLHDLVKAGLAVPGCLAAVVVGGGRLEEELEKKARELGWPVLASYGMTEACSQVATQREAGSGLEVLPIWEVCVEDGFLVISGEALFAGVIEGGCFVRRQGAYRTTDRVFLEGRKIEVLGRGDRLVKVLGVLVDLDEVERKVRKVAGDRELVVIALPDERKGRMIAAVFEGDDDCIQEYNASAEGLERISKVFVVKEFPRSTLGKLQMGRLEEMVGSEGYGL